MCLFVTALRWMSGAWILVLHADLIIGVPVAPWWGGGDCCQEPMCPEGDVAYIPYQLNRRSGQ